MEKMKILIGTQEDGLVFKLHPKARRKIEKKYKDKILPAHFFVAYDIKTNFENTYGSILGQVASILTGLSDDELKKLGGYQIIQPVDEKVVYDSDKN